MGGRWAQNVGGQRSPNEEQEQTRILLLIMGIAFTLFFFLPWAIVEGSAESVAMSWDIIDQGGSAWISATIIYSLLVGIFFVVMALIQLQHKATKAAASAVGLLGLLLLIAATVGSAQEFSRGNPLAQGGALAILKFLGIVLLATACHYKSYAPRSVAASVLIGISGLLVILAFLIPVKFGGGGSAKMSLVLSIKAIFNPSALGVAKSLRPLTVVSGLYDLALFITAIVSLIGAADMNDKATRPGLFMHILHRFFLLYMPVFFLLLFITILVANKGAFVPLILVWFGISLFFYLWLTVEGGRMALAALEGDVAPTPQPRPEPVPPRPVAPQPPQPRPRPPQPPKPRPRPGPRVQDLPSDVQARLAKLDEMLNKGLLTKEEHAEQKAHILAAFK